MSKWMVTFEYQMPGDDEFGHVSFGDWIVDADSKEEALAKFAVHRETCGRVPARFSVMESCHEMTQAHIDRYFSED